MWCYGQLYFKERNYEKALECFEKVHEKDKLLKDAGDSPLPLAPVANNTIRQEALSALLSLQVNKIQAQKVLNKILKEHPSINSVEEFVRLALKEL